MVTLDLSIEDARFLREQLARRAVALDAELVRTDVHALQRALARDGELNAELIRRIDELLAAAEQDEARRLAATG